MGEADGLLLAIGEAGHIFAGDQRRAIRPHDIAQHARSVADEGDGLARRDEGSDQSDRMRILGEIP